MSDRSRFTVVRGDKGDPIEAFRRAENEAKGFAADVSEAIVAQAEELARVCAEAQSERAVWARLGPAMQDCLRKWAALAADVERLRAIGGRR